MTTPHTPIAAVIAGEGKQSSIEELKKRISKAVHSLFHLGDEYRCWMNSNYTSEAKPFEQKAIALQRDADECLAALSTAAEQVERLTAERDLYARKAGLSTAWPLTESVAKLLEATGILMDRHNYDGHGHELIKAARDSARQWLDSIDVPPPTAPPGGILPKIPCEEIYDPDAKSRCGELDGLLLCDKCTAALLAHYHNTQPPPGVPDEVVSNPQGCGKVCMHWGARCGIPFECSPGNMETEFCRDCLTAAASLAAKGE